MNNHFVIQNSLIYLYDLPKDIATSIGIANIIKAKTGYELTEPVQFRVGKPNRTTLLPSPYVLGIIKVDHSEFKKVAEGIKYFKYETG